MGRRGAPQGKVIPKREDKVKEVFNNLGDDLTEISFIEKFKEMFPKDWTSIVRRYQEILRYSKPGKPIPMPEPTKYLRNMYKVYINKIRSSTKYSS